ncbi:MAG: selenocysteine-specific translation elongation factor [Planctomycetes bacterium]|nr:selenocysteine-specific translation elongation factor [Planctomycetota bacterium]
MAKSTPAPPAPPVLPAAGSAADEKIFNVVLGTAGHIDHGKSLLVQALTGINPDRLKEEQERGITIDLGFAPLVLKSGLRVGIIDVPGHERFIKNMVAGATGIDFVLLVVAADDGVMAQTREHLQIIRLLGVRDGMVAITKTDLAEPDFVKLVAEEVAGLAKGTCLEGKPIVPVSSKTGQGLDDLRARLETALAELVHRPAEGPFRMPIQRVFAKEGFGCVVTGVPLSGTLRIGDALAVLPAGGVGRVKGLHAYKERIDCARAGHSTAVNVAGVERKNVTRGMVAATPEVFRPSKLVAAKLIHLPDAPYPLKHRAPVRFHAGTAELLGRVRLLDGERLAPGAESFVQVLLEEPTVLCPGDRFILRYQSPMVTLGGGTILDNEERTLKRQAPEVIEHLQARLAALEDPRAFLNVILHGSPAARTCGDLCAALGRLPVQVGEDLAALEKAGLACTLKPGEAYLGAGAVEAWSKEVGACMAGFFKEHPALVSVDKPELKTCMKARLRARWGAIALYFDELLSLLAARGLLKLEANQVKLAGREPKLDAKWADHARKAEAALKAGALAPPSTAELEAALAIPPKALREVLRYLADTGKAVPISNEFHLHRSVYDLMLARVRELFAQGPEWTTSDIRKALNTSRKYAVPLLEHLDARGVTMRVGDKRRLAKS